MIKRWSRSEFVRATDPISIVWWVALLALLWVARQTAGAWINPQTALRPIDIASVLFAAVCVAMAGRGFVRLGAWAVVGQHLFLTAPILLSIGMLNPALGIGLAGVVHVLVARVGRYFAKELEVRKPGTCRVCEYDLVGVESPVCPECGTPRAAPAQPAPAQPVPADA